MALRPEVHLLANHLLENGLGLVCGGAVAEGPEADLWWSLGAALLNWQLGEQFLACIVGQFAILFGLCVAHF